MDIIAENLTNVYTPGFRENKVTFKTFLGGAVIDNNVKTEPEAETETTEA